MESVEVRICGALMICLSILFLTLQILFIMVCSKNCGFASDFAFTLMCFISALDCIQLVIHTFIGFVLTFKLGVPPCIRIIGAFMGSAWCTMVVTTVLLTFHRLIYTVWPVRAKTILSSFNSKMLLVLLFTFYVLLLTFNLSPYSALGFNIEFTSWYYVKDYPYSWIFALLDTISNYASAIITTLVYIVVFVFLFHGQSQIRKDREVRITLLVFSFCAYQLVCFIIWEFVMPVYEENTYIPCMALVMWVIWNGANAVLYMFFSVAFRQDMKNMISTRCCGSNQQSNTVLPISRTSANNSQKRTT